MEASLEDPQEQETGDQEVVEVPQFIVNLLGRLVAENEALKAGLFPAQSTVVQEEVSE